MSDTTVEVKQRDEIGKNANRRLRAAGGVPAVVYGGGKDPIAISVEKNDIHDLLRQAGGENAVFLLKLAGTGKARHTMVKEVVVDPISRQIIHIDFQRVLMTEKVKVQVPIELIGVPEGVKNQGGVLDFITRDVELECLPGDIPPQLELDVSALDVGDHVQVKDLDLPAKVEMLEEPDRVIASVAHSRVALDVEAAEAEAEAEGEEVLLEAEPQEPEVIGRGKEEEEPEETS
jgi:large subunit ribosomal protein L25